MLKRTLAAAVVLAVAVAGVAYVNRKAIVVYLVNEAGKLDVAENRPIEWQRGLVEAEMPMAERPPNVVFVLVDDLGINDISTFGGGVAGGRVPTPNIDRLASEGAVFTLSLIHISEPTRLC